MHTRFIAQHSEAGFTLAEAAIVLAILGLVIGLLVPSFLSLRVAEQSKTTMQTLQSVMNAIAGFVQSNGCVPCPTPARMSQSNGRGLVNGGVSNASCGTGTCTIPVGLLPFRSLGIPESMAKDGYGHWLTYAVDTSLVNFTATSPNTPSGSTGICSVLLTSSIPVRVRLGGNHIAVLVLSHGADGYGAYRNQPSSNTDRFPFPSSYPDCSSTPDAESCNAKDDITKFTASTPAQGANPFDDVMLYLDRNALVTYLHSAACTTVWQ